MKIAIASDHGGINLKSYIIEKLGNKFTFTDLGTNSIDSVDYPDYSKLVSQEILTKKVDFGILVCKSGIGISIAANKIPGIRCALIYTKDIASLVKEHNNANCLAFGNDYIDFDEACKSIEIYSNSKFEGGRHKKRIDKMG